MQRDLARLIGQLPVYCGKSADSQTIPCAWLNPGKNDEVRFSELGLMNADTAYIMVAASDMTPPPAFDSVLWVSGHRYRVKSVSHIDSVSLRITLARSDQ